MDDALPFCRELYRLRPPLRFCSRRCHPPPLLALLILPCASLMSLIAYGTLLPFVPLLLVSMHEYCSRPVLP